MAQQQVRDWRYSLIRFPCGTFSLFFPYVTKLENLANYCKLVLLDKSGGAKRLDKFHCVDILSLCV